jgi:hypothetical protein
MLGAVAKFNSFLIGFLSFAVHVAIAQPTGREVVNQPVEWFAVTTNWKVAKSTSIMLEGQFRQVGRFEPMQYQLRAAVDFTINKHFSFVPVGYVYTWNHLYGEQPTAFQNNEHRIWEQVSYKHSVSRFNVSHRLRLEQRFIQTHSISGEGVVDEGYGENFQNRLRYRFMATVPIGHDKIEPKTFYGSFYDEVFVSWGKLVTFHEPDQNRIFAGVGYQFTSALSVHGGPFYQMLIKANGARQENNIGFQIQVTYNVDLTKKE